MIKSSHMRWEVHVARMWETTNLYDLDSKPEGRRPLGKPKSR